MRFTHINFLLVEAGQKTATSRRISRLKYYLEKVGHRVWAISSFNPARRCKITIIGVSARRLKDVKEWWFAAEGCGTPEEFEEVWRAIYGDFDENEEVTFINFKLGWN